MKKIMMLLICCIISGVSPHITTAAGVQGEFEEGDSSHFLKGRGKVVFSVDVSVYTPSEFIDQDLYIYFDNTENPPEIGDIAVDLGGYESYKMDLFKTSLYSGEMWLPVGTYYLRQGGVFNDRTHSFDLNLPSTFEVVEGETLRQTFYFKSPETMNRYDTLSTYLDGEGVVGFHYVPVNNEVVTLEITSPNDGFFEVFLDEANDYYQELKLNFGRYSIDNLYSSNGENISSNKKTITISEDSYEIINIGVVDISEELEEEQEKSNILDSKSIPFWLFGLTILLIGMCICILTKAKAMAQQIKK